MATRSFVKLNKHTNSSEIRSEFLLLDLITYSAKRLRKKELWKKVHSIFRQMGTLLQFEYTVWKFQDFSVAQILREINCGKSRTSTTAAFVIFGALNYVNLISRKK